MNRRVRLLAAAGLALLLLSVVVVGSALAQTPGPQGGQGGPGWGRGMGGGMMGGMGMRGWGYSQPAAPVTGTLPYNGYGCGMAGGYGFGMTGGGMTPAPDGAVPGAGVGGWGVPANGQPITMDQAVKAAQQYVAAYNNTDLAAAEIMEFANNFYVLVKEKSTGQSAFELLVIRFNGAVYPEMGPNMMWNTKYGHMGGMMMGMGAWNNPQAGAVTVSEQQARTYAQQFLDANFAGAKLADDTAAFYGYYTFDFLQNGTPAGMLSVNGYTGQVWYHSWHGAFVTEKEL